VIVTEFGEWQGPCEFHIFMRWEGKHLPEHKPRTRLLPYRRYSKATGWSCQLQLAQNDTHHWGYESTTRLTDET